MAISGCLMCTTKSRSRWGCRTSWGETSSQGSVRRRCVEMETPRVLLLGVQSRTEGGGGWGMGGGA